MATRMFGRKIVALIPALVVAAGLAAPAGAQSRWFDEATGRDLASYPRHPAVDYTHMVLHVLIPDMNTRRMEVVQELTFTPVVGEVDHLRLDAKLMEIRSVKSSVGSATFTHDGEALNISLDRPVAAGNSCTITTTYSVVRASPGLSWTPESPAWPGRPAQLHSKGEPEQNSYWFPCHDFPNDRLTTEIEATVPAAFEVVSNGRLLSVQNKAISVREAGGEKSADPKVDSRLGMYRKFHWLQDKPHVPYLVTMAVGRWDVVDVGTKDLKMPVYAPLGRGGDVKANFGRTAEMIGVFAQAFDEPYPWDKYAQVMVHNYLSGATENTSATTFYDGSIHSAEGLLDTDPEGLISHELVHQWFGDLVTCRSWEHIWLNEAWATYGEAIWFAHRDGPAGYEAHVLRQFQSALGQDTGSAPDSPGMVSKQFRHARDVFVKAASPYAKGASVLHMLRARIGDAAFFRGTAEYLDRFKFGEAETSDLQAVMEEASGESLDQFFSQWCTRPGHPVLDVTLGWNGESSRLSVKVGQTQKIDGPNPAIEFDLPIVAHFADGGEKRGVVEVRGRSAEFSMDLHAEPVWVSVDPGLTVLAKISVDAPHGWLRAQTGKGETIAARVQGIRALAELKDEKAASQCEIVVFTPDQHELVKLEAIKSLRKLKDAGTLETCVIGRPPLPAVREAAVSGLADVAGNRKGAGAERGRERAAEMLVKLYGVDKSAKVRAACIRGLGTLKAEAYQPLVISAASVESPGDRVRQAAIRALADLGAPEAVAVAIMASEESAPDRTRPVAFEALVKLKEHDPDAALEKIGAAVIAGPERTRRAAGRSLVNLADPRGADLLRALIEASPDRAEREMLGEWLADLNKKLPEAPKAEAEDGSGASGAKSEERPEEKSEGK